MKTYDFYINRIEGENTLVTEKRKRRSNADVTLEQYLYADDVTDAERGRVIEELEALPYGAAETQTTGRHGLIKIKQEN